MSELASAVAQSSVFQGYVSGEAAALAVKGNTQIFVAVSNVVKVASLVAKNSTVKVLDLSSEKAFDATALVFNATESLLAVVGKEHIVVVDTKMSPDFQDRSTSWGPMNVAIKNTASQIKSVFWNPASPTDSQLVVLTEKEILVYDVVYSFSNPLLSVQFASFPQLANKTVSSIAMGSTKNFAGSITLYLSTEGGEVFAIYPFLVPGAQITNKKASVKAFVDEWQSHLHAFKETVPPSVALDPFRAIFSSHEQFMAIFESQLNSPMNSKLADTDDVSISCNVEKFKVNLHGPLANSGPNCQLVVVNASEDFPLLATACKASSGATIKYLAQLLPLTMPFTMPESQVGKMQKPEPSSQTPKEKPYTKPARGFGYVSDSEPEEEEVDHVYETKLKAYNEQASLQKAQDKIRCYVEENFLSLTELSTDETGLAYSPTASLAALEGTVAFNSGSSILVGETGPAVQNVLRPEGNFEVAYLQAENSIKACALASFTDTIEGTGQYLVAFNPGHKVLVKNIKPEQNKAPRRPAPEMKALPKETQRQCLTNHVLSADELKQIIRGAGAKLPAASNFDPKNVESLKLVHQMTSESMKQTNSLTKFALAFHRKLQIQVEELRLQLRELGNVYASVGEEEKHVGNVEKVEALLVRQKQLMEKEKALRASIVERFQAHIAKQQLPLSAAERGWFKELNSITGDLKGWEDSTQSWTSTVSSLKSTVSGLESGSETPDDEKLSATLAELSLGTNFPRLSHALTHESKIIHVTKTRLDACLSQINGALET